jgi:UPF0271 protein
MQLIYRTIDLNADLGESFGAYRLGSDEEIMPYITSANIACGLHAGDPLVMERTVDLALQHGVAIGAHPGFPDLAGFGRRVMQLSPDEVETNVLYQLGALYAFVRARGATLAHVKPHGALYNVAAADGRVAAAIAKAVKRFDSQLIVVCLPNSVAADAAQERGLRVAFEGFADRAYNPDGSLVARHLPGAVIHDHALVVTRALRMVREGKVEACDGEDIAMRVDTICVHGDTAGAPRLAAGLRAAFAEAGISVSPFGRR